MALTGEQLFRSIYPGTHNKLTAKLSQLHPDLPLLIKHFHYGGTLSSTRERNWTDIPIHKPDALCMSPQQRVLTSVTAIGCLHTGGGAGAQLMSHVLGLESALRQYGTSVDVEDDAGGGIKGAKWISSVPGIEWVLGEIDWVNYCFNEEEKNCEQ